VTCSQPSSSPAAHRAAWDEALLPSGRPFLEHLLDVSATPKSARDGWCWTRRGAYREEINLSSDEIVINEDWERGN
jgi:hypothetical protein